ncbi:MAG: AAA family ATPase, partial [Gammaproteobacteria bacterium]|nr:AAA family ATPase [Gammaproteobacteria bacterium]
MNIKPLQDLVSAWNGATERGDPDAIDAATNALIDLAKRHKIAKERSAAVSKVAELVTGDADKLNEALSALATYPTIEPAPAPVPPVELMPLDEVNDPKPQAVIWRDEMAGSWLARGEVAVLSGAGGGGKSTLALQWTLAAARNELHGTDQGAVAGCRVAAGQVVYLSWEDRRRRLKDRADKITRDWGDDPSHLVQVAEGNGPIFGPPPETPLFNARPVPLPNWDDLWKKIREVPSLSLVVLDPVMSAFAGDASRVEGVRLFLDELRAEAELANCGILL